MLKSVATKMEVPTITIAMVLACWLTISPVIAQTAPQASVGSVAISVPTPLPDTETVENPYGLAALWNGGDFVARGTLVSLIIMSMGTWYIMITKLIEQSLLIRQGRHASRIFWTAPSIRDGANLLPEWSAYRAIVEEGLSSVARREGTLIAQIEPHTRVTLSLQRVVESINNRMQGGLAVLATVGSTAPFVGLFGTVWGIYHALTAIGISGQASIDKVAGPVGEALIMTAAGLAVAVPAVLGYNWMIRRNKGAMELVRNFAADLHALLVGVGGNSTRPEPAVQRAGGEL